VFIGFVGTRIEAGGSCYCAGVEIVAFDFVFATKTLGATTGCYQNIGGEEKHERQEYAQDYYYGCVFGDRL